MASKNMVKGDNEVKKILMAITLALVLLVAFSIPVFAGGGEDVKVEVSDITIVGSGWVYSYVTASGTVVVTATAGSYPANWQWGFAGADGSAYHSVTNPDGVVVAGDSASSSDFAFAANPPGPANFPADVDASITYTWSETFYVNGVGEWTITHGGDADAYWATFFGFTPTGGDYDSASAEKSVVFRSQSYYSLFTIMVNGEPWYAAPRFLYDDARSCNVMGMIAAWGDYQLSIPAWTSIFGADGKPVHFFKLNADGENMTFTPDILLFSQPVTLYKLVGGFGGTWVEVGSFSAVVNGVPVWD